MTRKKKSELDGEDDLRFYTSFVRHPKVLELKDRLGSDAIWSLISLWCWAREKHHTGELVGETDRGIELVSNWTGERGALVAALLEIRFLEGESGSRRIYNWPKRQPFAVETTERKERARNAANARHHPESVHGACSEHAGSMPDACGVHAPSSLLPPPSSSPPSEEKKRREPAEEGQPDLGLAAEPGPDVATPDRVLDLYNAIVPDGRAWVEHRRMLKDLRPKLNARIGEAPERRSLAWWRSLFEHVEARVTWTSKQGLEFIVRNDGQLQKFVDGGFDDRSAIEKPRPPNEAEKAFAQAAALRSGLELEPIDEATQRTIDLAVRSLALKPIRRGYVARAPPPGASEQGAFGFGAGGPGGGEQS